MTLSRPKIDIKTILAASETALKKQEYGRAFRICMSVLNAFPAHPAAKKLYRKLTSQGPVTQRINQYLASCEPDKASQKSLLDLAEKKEFTSLLHAVSETLKGKPESVFLHQLGATAAVELGHHQQAEAYFKSALQLDPLNFQLFLNFAVYLRDHQEFSRARDYLYYAHDMQPDNCDILSSLAQLEIHLNQFSLAEHLYVRASNIQPHVVSHLLGYFSTLIDQQKFSTAQKVIAKLKSSSAEAWRVSLCQAYAERKSGRYEHALRAIIDAENQTEPQAEILIEKANIYKDQMMYDKAMAALQSALVCDPSSHTARWNLSFCELMLGHFEEGWRHYESRWHSIGWNTKYLQTRKPLWDSKQSGRLLIWNEQGIGDEVMHLSLLDIIPDTVDTLIVRTDPRLIPLLKRSQTSDIASRIHFVSSADPIDENSYDFHIPAGSVAGALNFHANSRQTPPALYLKADTKKTSELESRLPPDRKMTIGISWKSVGSYYGDSRNILLQDLITNLGGDGTHFINLQYGDIRQDVRKLSDSTLNQISLFDDIDKMDDLDSLSALISCCDVIVSIPNVTVHLAGGLGVPCHALLRPHHGWEWHHQLTQSYWYRDCQLHRLYDVDDLRSILTSIKSG